MKITVRDQNIKTFLKTVKFDSNIFKNIEYVKSGSTGHTFKGTFKADDKILQCAFKIVPFEKDTIYGDPDDEERPENAELKMLKLLSNFVLDIYTPHIILPIRTFHTNIKNFICKKINDKHYKEFIKKYKDDELHNNVSVLISEWADQGDLLMFLKKNYHKLTLKFWKTLFFQIISTLAIIQLKYPSFRHNDLKCNNILISTYDKQDRDYFIYMVDKMMYKIPYIGYYIGIWDFDFACIPGIVENSKVNAKWTKKINVNPVRNQYYDMHFFFNTLIKKGFLPQLLTSCKIDKEIKDFIYRIVPRKLQKNDKYLSEKGRILINKELHTPIDIIENDPFFEEFRIKKLHGK